MWGVVLLADRAAVLLLWRDASAVVVESRLETEGARHAARIRVRFASESGIVETEPRHAYRAARYAWVAEAVERHPVGGLAAIRYDPDDPARAWLDAGVNFATFGWGLLLAGSGFAFGAVGALALRSARLQRHALAAPSKRSAPKPWSAELLQMGAFIGLIGLAFVVAAAVLAPPRLAALRWPVVTGSVDRGDVFARWASGTGKRPGSTRHVVRLYVAYEFGGRPYTTTVEAGASTRREDAERRLAAIPKGSTRSLRVDPRNPHRAERADTWPLWLPAIFAGLGLALCCVAGLLVRSARRSTWRGARPNMRW